MGVRLIPKRYRTRYRHDGQRYRATWVSWLGRVWRHRVELVT